MQIQKSKSKQAYGNTLILHLTKTTDTTTNIHSMTWGIFFWKWFKAIHQKHEPHETQFIFFAIFQASISMRRGWILRVVSHLSSTMKSDQIPVSVCLVFLCRDDPADLWPGCKRSYTEKNQ